MFAKSKGLSLPDVLRMIKLLVSFCCFLSIFGLTQKLAYPLLLSLGYETKSNKTTPVMDLNKRVVKLNNR